MLQANRDKITELRPQIAVARDQAAEIKVSSPLAMISLLLSPSLMRALTVLIRIQATLDETKDELEKNFAEQESLRAAFDDEATLATLVLVESQGQG